jgi:hypothetical protein
MTEILMLQIDNRTWRPAAAGCDAKQGVADGRYWITKQRH